MEMTYTTCEVCGTEQYCFLQFRTDVQEDESSIKKAACPQCLSAVYKSIMNDKQVKALPYYS
jgi:hypothetical protein